MARFATLPALPAVSSPHGIGRSPNSARTAQGGSGYIPSDAHAELFRAAVGGLLTDGFYESSDARIARLIGLVPQCDPAWLRDFIPWLRSEALMRSAPIVLAAEYAAAKMPDARTVVNMAMQRADEPGEMLGYWMSRHGRNIPSRVKRGISDACARLYTEVAALRYDGAGRPWRFGDVLEVVHAKPTNEAQSALYKFLLDRRRHQPTAHPGLLPKMSRTLMVEALPAGERTPERLAAILEDRDVVMSWERVAGWLNGPMTAAAWEAVIPTMGYFALLRNLNNFDRAGISKRARDQVAFRLVEDVRGSKVLPFRLLTAYSALEADTYRVALADAADQAMVNLPWFKGRTLIMVDCSGSMGESLGGKSRFPLSRSRVAGFLAESLARRCDEAIIAPYDTALHSLGEPQHHVGVLRAASDQRYAPRGGTATWRCMEQALVFAKNPDRVIVITDEQTSDSDTLPSTLPIITWNIAGYQAAHADHGARNRFYVAGYSDAVMQTLPSAIAHGATGRWPWEVGA